MLDALVGALAGLPGVTVTNHGWSAGQWIVKGTLTPGGARSFSIIAFVVDRRVSGVTLSGDRGTFVLSGAGEPPAELAREIEFGRGVIREREARN